MYHTICYKLQDLAENRARYDDHVQKLEYKCMQIQWGWIKAAKHPEEMHVESPEAWYYFYSLESQKVLINQLLIFIPPYHEIYLRKQVSQWLSEDTETDKSELKRRLLAQKFHFQATEPVQKLVNKIDF